MKLLDLSLVAVTVSCIGLASYITTNSLNTCDAKQHEIQKLQEKIANLYHRLTFTNSKLSKSNSLLESIFQKDMSEFSIAKMDVTVTAYSASIDETDSTPYLTADLTLSRVGLLAVSRDLLSVLSYGQRVILPDYGVFVVADTMNSRFTNRVDILHVSKLAARKFGIHHHKELIFTF